MRILNLKHILAATAALALIGATPALAQNAPDLDNDGADEELVHSEPGMEQLPDPQSDSDPRPPVAVPAIPEGGVVQQAGIGGLVAYGRAGVLELGGSAGLAAASGITAASLNPSIGWFAADNLQLSGILGVSHIATDQDNVTILSLLVEPSYHMPLNRSVFGFLGLGVGGSHVDEAGTGFAVAPRIGANIMVGRSGILSPSVAYQYTTHDTIEMEDGTTLLSVSTSLSANVGYTVMW